MKKIPLFASAVLAGMCIGFGGLAFLSVENRVIGKSGRDRTDGAVCLPDTECPRTP